MLPVRTFMKFLLGGLAGILVLLVALAVIVFVLVKPEEYRDLVVDNVRRETGRELVLAGPLSLDLFPCCALEVGEATLGNPPGFGGEPFLQVASARVALRLWPLITTRSLQISTVSIDGLRANLQVARDGQDNWTFADRAAAAGGDGGGTGGGLGDVSLAGLRVTNAILGYTDEGSGARYRADDVELTTGPIRGREPFDLSTALTVTDLADSSSAGLTLRARVVPGDADAVAVVALEGLEAGLDGRGLAGFETVQGKFATPLLRVESGGTTSLHLPSLTADLRLGGADLPGGAVALEATVSELRYDVDGEQGSLASFNATAGVAGVPLTLTGGGEFGARNALRGTLKFPEVSPRALLAALGEAVPATADARVLQKLAGKADWFLREDAAGVEALDLALDDSRITGNVSRELLADGSRKTPRTRFDLNIDQLDLDRYLEPESASGAGGGAGDSAGALPTDTLRGLNLGGRIRLGRLIWDGLKMADVAVGIEAAGGRLELSPLTASLYGGELKGRVGLDARGAEPRLAISQALTGIALGGLLADFAGVHNLSGTVNLNLEGAGAGPTSDALLDNLAGSVAVSMTDGIYSGLDVWHDIRRAWALAQMQPPPARTGPEQTAIKALDLSGRLANGRLTTDRLLVEIPFLRVSGGATVNVRDKTLDSSLTALVFEKPVFGEDESLAGLVNARIPLVITGPVASPKVRVDLSRMVRGAVTDELKDVLRQKGGRLLDRLGLGSPAAPAPAPAPAEGSVPDGGETAAPATDPAEAPPPQKDDRLRRTLDRLLKPDAPD